VNRVIPLLKENDHYQKDEKARSVALNEDGIGLMEKALQVDNLYDPGSIETLHHVNQALKAHALFKDEVDYVINEGQVVIIDEFTGRMMPGRRYGDGLHQALEAKEGVNIENENQTLATITFQNYFRMYKKLGGMTGTADTEAEEFHSTYRLAVVVVPTNQPMIRNDYPDLIYRTEQEKFEAVIDEVKELNDIGRPVLVGTISIEKSELLSRMLKKAGINHNVLNAKHHAKEAEIIADAGQNSAVTIATNMAGRGTDIVLGEGVAGLGGLHILGTERHESRRIDNQLRGRSGRQGDQGTSRFYLSLEDDLLRIFGSEKISGLMGKLGMEKGEPIEHTMVSKAVENAQRKVEAHNFDIRKHLLEYDDVMNKQREIIYAMRKDILTGDNQKEILFDTIEDVLEEKLALVCSKDIYPEEWDIEEINILFERLFLLRVQKIDDKVLDIGGIKSIPLENCDQSALQSAVMDIVMDIYNKKEALVEKPIMRHLEKMIMLQVLDSLWMDHLLGMDHLKEGIGLRGYAQKNPLTEYKKEGFDMFSAMNLRIKEEITEYLFKVSVTQDSEVALEKDQDKRKIVEHRGGDSEESKPVTVKRTEKKTGRNEPCPCGSGKKYKKCHGK